MCLVVASSSMAVPLEPLLVVLGLVLAATGMFVYRVALIGFGGLLGGAAGLLTGVAIGADLVVFVAIALVGAIVGIVLVQSAFHTALLGAGAITGLAGGMYVAGASLTSPGTLADPLIAVGVVLGVVAAWFFESVIVLVVSAAWGASLVAIGLADIQDVTNVTEIVDAFVSPVLVAVFVGGIVVQTGLWYYLNHYRQRDNSGGGIAG